MKLFYRTIVVLCSIFTLAQAQTTEIRLTANDSHSGDQFGAAVILHDNYLLVGAPGANDGKGAVYVFVRTDAGWEQEAKLTASDGSTDEDFDDFGSTLAMDGNFLVVGAAQRMFMFTIPKEKGAAYVFERTDAGWVQQARLTARSRKAGEYFGWSVAISGNQILIGATGFPAGSLSKGAAYLFERRDNRWIQTAKLTASDASEQKYMGTGVWISGDLAIVGAPGCCFNRGSAYIFKKESSGWMQKAKIEPRDPISGNQFGESISGYNGQFLIGAPGWVDATGKAYVFTETASGWEQLAEVQHGRTERNVGDFFGQTVALHGDYALVGAQRSFGNPPGEEKPGLAFLFKRTDSGWEQILKIGASVGINGDTFGWSVAFDGRYAAIGAPGLRIGTGNVPGAVYVYDLSSVVVSVEETVSAIPESFILEQNYPNPFNPSTVIQYQIATTSAVELTIYNDLGHPVKTLIREKQSPGFYKIVWDGTDDLGRKVASGVYLYQLRAGQQILSKKMIFMQ